MAEERPQGPDLRTPVLALGGWAGGLVTPLVPGEAAGGVASFLLIAGPVGLLLGGLAALTVATARAWRGRESPPRAGSTVLGVVGVFLAVAVAGMLRVDQLAGDPVARLAGDGATVTAVVIVAGDPRVRDGRFGEQVFFRADVERVNGRGATHDVHVPVLVVADPGWARVRLGAALQVEGRLSPARDEDLAGVLAVHAEPIRVADPDVWWRAAETVRESLRASVAERPASQRALVPALVVGDAAEMEATLVDDFQTTGLTHLTAVSGTNLTLLVGFLLVLARWLGVRGHGLHVVAVAGIVGFLLLARAEPSVVRAAAMGTVALIGLGSNGLRRGTRALGVAVVVLLLVDPWLAASVGFALSVLATAGILLLAPAWRDALVRWLPRWLAEAISVPAAAQLACTPVVAAISGQVSLVAVVANLVVAPVVGPATVLGLAGGLLGLVWGPVGALAGTGASWCVAWIVLVAEQGARLPGAAVDWGAGPAALAVLTLVCLCVAWAAPRLLRHPVTGLASSALLVVTVVSAPPTPGWPASGWVLAACDVGQGDALVLHVGDGQGVVVDAGPDPAAVDACLRRLDIREVPWLVLTHFHADHVDGLRGVLAGRSVGEVLVTSVADPAEGAADVAAAAAEAGVPVRVPTYGETRAAGPATVQVLWPPADPARVAAEGSVANNSSLVLLVEVAGLRVLLAGDIEPEAQAALSHAFPGLSVDVLKLPHHGSRHQDLEFLTGLQPRVVLVSVGADNDYGHPAVEALHPFEAAGVEVLRTDVEGDLLVVVRDGRLLTATR
ncbi:MAG: ComEC/Rec2 family competence protein [Nocardioides sp.]